MKALLGDSITVLAVAQGNGDGYLAGLLVEVDDHGCTGATLHDNLLAVLAIDDILGLIDVAVAELIDGFHHGVFELVVTHLADLVVAPVVLAGTAVRA